VSDHAPVLHIASKSLNVLDGKSLIVSGASEIRTENNCLRVNDSKLLRIEGSITISAWFNAHLFDKSMTVIGRAQNGPPWNYPFLSWLIRINTDSLVEADVGDGRSYSPSGWNVPALQAGQWYFVAMTYDGNRKTLFVNGVAISSLASGSPTYADGIRNATGKPILIGADESESPVGDLFDGSIDEVNVFDVALSAEEIQSLYTQGAAGHRAR